MGVIKKSCNGVQKIFINGVIHSINKKNNVYEAMVIKDGTIVALGSNEEVRKYSTNETEVVDLKFRIVIPGFIDAHCHMPERMMIRRDELSLYEASNLKDYLKLIQSYIDSHPEEKIIYGIGWENFVFERGEENSYNYTEVFKGPNKKWLEKMKTSKPIVLKAADGHSLWLNNEAFRYFKITKDTKVPVGGKIELDEQGELWGTLKENAMSLVSMDRIQNSKNYKQLEYLNKFIKYQNILHSYGVTTISLIDDDTLEMPLELFKRLENEQKLKLRVIYGVTIKPQKICKRTIHEQMHYLKRNSILYKTKLLDISITKFFADGFIEKMTAYLFKPYESIESTCKSNGMFLWDYDEFKEGIKMANRFDFNVCVHAAGDFACKLSIDAIECSYKNNSNHGYRNSLIRMDLITRYYMRRMKSLNINAIIQPFWFYKDVSSSKHEVLAIGEERAHRQYPLKSLIDEGIITAGSSDNGVLENANPLKAIECSILRNMYDFIPSGYPKKVDMNDTRYRLNPRERISALESIKMFTINAAYVLGKENEIGSLEVGKRADFIVLDRDIFLLNPLDISNINIDRTYFNGELVYLNE